MHTTIQVLCMHILHIFVQNNLNFGTVIYNSKTVFKVMAKHSKSPLFQCCHFPVCEGCKATWIFPLEQIGHRTLGRETS